MARILIVDDDPDVRTYLSSLFEDHGYETVTAEDGETGLQRCAEQPPNLITLDIIMPNQTGVKMYRTIARDVNLKNIPVVIVSGVTRYKELFRKEHKTMPKPAAFLEKPVDRDLLLKTVKDLLG